MIAVIQCANRKRPEAGYLETSEGRRVCFVANPEAAPASDMIYARPDDRCSAGGTWREALLAYNQRQDNPLGLLPAGELYQNPIYQRLARHVGSENLFILSAGWGLIPASFLTPVYDITFSNQAEKYKRRRRKDVYDDFCMLPPGTSAPVVFFGSTEYAPLFAALTSPISAPKTIFYRSSSAPDAPGCRAISYITRRRTNWQYECAEALISGTLDTEELRPW